MKASNAAALALLRLRGADGVTPAEARAAIACDRLAARVHELKAFGYDIETYRERSPMGAVFARYVLRERPAPTTGTQETLDLDPPVTAPLSCAPFLRSRDRVAEPLTARPGAG